MGMDELLEILREKSSNKRKRAHQARSEVDEALFGHSYVGVGWVVSWGELLTSAQVLDELASRFAPRRSVKRSF